MSTSIEAPGHVTASAAMLGVGDGIAKPHAAKRHAAEDAPDRNIQAVVAQLNASLKLAGTKLRFAVDDVTKQTVVTVVDEDSGEVIRQIPSETMLKISQNITRLLGAMFDKAM
jgi:flagellar protein FlaG